MIYSRNTSCFALACLLFAGCPAGDSKSVADGGASSQLDASGTPATDSGAGSSGAGGSGAGSSGAGGGSAGSGGAGGSAGVTATAGNGASVSGDIPAAGTATVVVAKAAGPLMTTTYELADTGKFAGQRNNDEFYANFDGQQDFGSMYGGDNISLRFSGFNRTGTFACGDRAKPNDSYAVQTNIELWTAVNAKSELKQFKGNNAGSSCSVTVTKLDATTIEGTYEGKLYVDATTFVQVSGAFHAIPN